MNFKKIYFIVLCFSSFLSTLGQPTVNFSASPSSGCVPLTVHFQDESTQGEAEIVNRIWSFGDGATSIQKNPTHTYTDTGDFKVIYEIADADGFVEKTIYDIHVSPYPEANFYPISTTTPCYPALISFYDSTDSKGDSISSYFWLFGDEKESINYENHPGHVKKNPIHTYHMSGQYDVKLIVTNEYGCRDTAFKADFIDIQGPYADFYIDTSSKCIRDTVNFMIDSLRLENLEKYIWHYDVHKLTGEDIGTSTDTVFIDSLQMPVQHGQYTYKNGGKHYAYLELIGQHDCHKFAPQPFALKDVYDSILIHPTQENISTRNDQYVCPGTTVPLYVFGGTGFYWSTGDTLSKIDVTPDHTNEYIVSFKENGCAISDTITVFTDSSYCYTFDVRVSHTTCGEEQGAASVQIHGGVPPFYVLWSTGDTTMAINNLSSGQYSVQVKDGLDNIKYKTFNVNDSGSIEIAETISHLSCKDANDGEIEITITGGTTPYYVSWSNGSDEETIRGLEAGIYRVTVEDATGCMVSQSYNLVEPVSMQTVSSTINASCALDTGKIAVSVTGGTPPYHFEWNDGSTDSLLTGKSAGTYTVTVTDMNGCTTTTSANISSKDGPVISIDSVVNTDCNTFSGKIHTTVSSPMPYDIFWSNGTNQQDLQSLQAGAYTITVTDSVGCNSITSAKIAKRLPSTPQICMVTTDTADNNNLVLWNHINDPSIVSYNIYKDIREGTFQQIGNVDASEHSIYKDTLSNASLRSYQYKVSAVDLCGNESKASSFIHKTIHLTGAPDFDDNTMMLIWEHYEGFYYTTYNLYRYSITTGIENITTISGNPDDAFIRYIDDNVTEDIMYYFLSVEKDHPCDISADKKSAGTLYEESLSNVVMNTLYHEQGMNTIVKSHSLARAYPNPFQGQFNIEYTLTQKSEVIIEIYDIRGLLIEEYTNKNQSSGKCIVPFFVDNQGVCIAKIRINGTETIKKLISVCP